MPKTRVSKSQFIRDYLTRHPNAAPQEIMAAFNEAYPESRISPEYVSSISRGAQRGQEGSSPKKAHAKPREEEEVETPRTVDLDSLLKVKTIVEELGGVDEAQKALNAFRKFYE